MVDPPDRLRECHIRNALEATKDKEIQLPVVEMGLTTGVPGMGISAEALAGVVAIGAQTKGAREQNEVMVESARQQRLNALVQC